MKTYQARYPENFGVPRTTKLLFKRTANGYAALVKPGAWIGMPKYIIENNPKLFKELRYDQNKRTMGRDQSPTDRQRRVSNTNTNNRK